MKKEKIIVAAILVPLIMVFQLVAWAQGYDGNVFLFTSNMITILIGYIIGRRNV